MDNFPNNDQNNETPQNTGSYSGGYGDYGNLAGQYPPPAAPEKKGLSLYAVIILILVTAIVSFQVTSLWYQKGVLKSRDDEIPSYFDNALIIDEYLREYYIGELDWETISQLLAAAILYASGDNYAYYYTPEEFAEENRSNEGGGIGVGIATRYREDYYVEITQVYEGAPASEAGLLKGDIIIAIDGNDLSLMSYTEFSTAMLGEIGSTINITIKRGEELLDFSIIRKAFTYKTVYIHIYKEGATEKKIGVVQIYSFNNSTTEQFIQAVNGLVEQGVEGLVFDVRDNHGGTLDSVVGMLDFLLPEGKLVRIIDKNGNEVQTYTSDKNCIDLPMTVLTNGETASAAELFTAALKDYEKAISIGTKSFGKGTVQILISLPDGGAFKFSYMYYSPPISENFHGVGIFPEIEIELPAGTDVRSLTDENDPQLAAAVEYIINGK